MSRSARRAREHSLGGIFAIPLLLAILSLVGLIAALVGDGAWDAVSWVTLAIPVTVTGWMLRPPRGQSP